MSGDDEDVRGETRGLASRSGELVDFLGGALREIVSLFADFVDLLDPSDSSVSREGSDRLRPNEEVERVRSGFESGVTPFTTRLDGAAPALAKETAD